MTCVARGLLENDNEWTECYEEASLFACGKSLRALFATSLLHGGITNAITMWNQFSSQFCDDLPHLLQNWPNIPNDLLDPHLDYGFCLLSELLKETEKTLDQYELPLPKHIWHPDNSLIRRELEYDPMIEVLEEAEKVRTFNLEQ